MADPPLRLFPHPLPVVANVLGEPRRPLPALRCEVLPIRGVDRRPSREPGWDLDHGLGDENGDRVEVARVRLQSQPLRLQGDGPTPGEWIVERREPLAVEQVRGAGVIGVLRAGPAPALPDLGPCPFEHLFVGGALPADQVPEDLEQPFSLLLRSNLAERLSVVRAVPALPAFTLGGAPLRRVRQQHVHVSGRVIHHLAEEDGPSRREWPARPPEVERGGMAVADGFLPRGCLVDGVERQRHLDQLLRHHLADDRPPGVIGSGTGGLVASPPSVMSRDKSSDRTEPLQVSPCSIARSMRSTAAAKPGKSRSTTLQMASKSIPR